MPTDADADADVIRNYNTNDYFNKLTIMSNNNILNKGAKFNLQNIYGAESLDEMDGKLKTYKQINNFMRDYSYNQNKSTCVKIIGYDKDGNPKRACGGDRVVYACTDSECDFIAFWRRKKKSNGFFSLIKQKSHNAMCNSRPKPSYKQLSKLPSFKASIKSSSHPTKKSVVTSALDNDEINLFHRKKESTVYKAIAAAKLEQSPPNYDLIESFLSEIKKNNKHVKCALEVSVDKSFCLLLCPTYERVVYQCFALMHHIVSIQNFREDILYF